MIGGPAPPLATRQASIGLPAPPAARPAAAPWRIASRIVVEGSGSTGVWIAIRASTSGAARSVSTARAYASSGDGNAISRGLPIVVDEERRAASCLVVESESVDNDRRTAWHAPAQRTPGPPPSERIATRRPAGSGWLS